MSSVVATRPIPSTFHSLRNHLLRLLRRRRHAAAAAAAAATAATTPHLSRHLPALLIPPCPCLSSPHRRLLTSPWSLSHTPPRPLSPTSSTTPSTCPSPPPPPPFYPNLHSLLQTFSPALPSSAASHLTLSSLFRAFDDPYGFQCTLHLPAFSHPQSTFFIPFLSALYLYSSPSSSPPSTCCSPTRTVCRRTLGILCRIRCTTCHCTSRLLLPPVPPLSSFDAQRSWLSLIWYPILVDLHHEQHLAATGSPTTASTSAGKATAGATRRRRTREPRARSPLPLTGPAEKGGEGEGGG